MTEEDEANDLIGGPKRGIDWFRLFIWAVTVLFCGAVLYAILWPLIAMVMS